MTQIPFNELGLHPEIARAIEALGFEMATTVQSEAIPPIREGWDIVAQSQTGTGKTLAFAIPAIELIAKEEQLNQIYVLVLCPTRELAQQAAAEVRKLARFMPEIRVAEVYGGANIDRQCMELRRANIVIGTPGRVMDHMRRKTLKLNSLKMLILDEADEMLNMGFKEDIETILADVPEERQTVMFSATMPPAIKALTKNYQRSPRHIEVDKGRATIDEIIQEYIQVPHASKMTALLVLVEYLRPKRAILFGNTKLIVDELTDQLNAHGFAAESIHSDIKQSQRTSVMNGFKQGRTKILVATDIAARGIDVSDVDLVINYDVPQNTEYYIHRIGRTGRAGKTGRSLTICGGRREASVIRSVVSRMGSSISEMFLPTQSEIDKNRNEELAKLLVEWIEKEPSDAIKGAYWALASQGFSEMQIAFAAMNLHFADRFKNTEATSSLDRLHASIKKTAEQQLKPKPVREAREYASIIINIGSLSNVKKNHVLGAMMERVPLTSKDIGKIEIYPEHTIVEVPPHNVDEVVKAMAGCQIIGRHTRTEKLSGAIRPKRQDERHAKSKDRPFRKHDERHGRGERSFDRNSRKPQRRENRNSKRT